MAWIIGGIGMSPVPTIGFNNGRLTAFCHDPYLRTDGVEKIDGRRGQPPGRRLSASVRCLRRPTTNQQGVKT